MTTSERVVEILVGEGGYRELPKPLKIGTLLFDFTHILVAGNKANDLVIVIELKGDTADDVVVRKVLALTRALDVLRSRRSLTAVLTSGQADPDTVRAISRVCRVLPIGSPTGPNSINAVRDWLSVLLPLREPQAVENLIDWERDVRSVLPNHIAGQFVEDMLKAATFGKGAVEGVLEQDIRAAVEQAIAEGNEGE
ncbi:hypothetical protein NKH72_12455 [Mesorhizobium sp. M0955]|uniref:hypothetical protein n=1 Tax=Mesorhizobium sp. M0955 TaxID=2957033 RepID=UPI0033357E27